MYEGNPVEIDFDSSWREVRVIESWLYLLRWKVLRKAFMIISTANRCYCFAKSGGKSDDQTKRYAHNYCKCQRFFRGANSLGISKQPQTYDK